MRGDLQRVSDRVVDAARVPYPEISAILEEIVRSGGKRLRPLLVLLAGRGWNYAESFETLVSAAAGVELLHTASLVHDDAVDHSAFRRGKPTLNSQVDTSAVILVGDYLFAQSAILAASTNNPRVVAVFSNSCGAVASQPALVVFGPVCDPDVNQDGNVDQDDVSYLINVVGGGDNPTGIDPDFNQDGNVDQDDVSYLINVVAGGPNPTGVDPDFTRDGNADQDDIASLINVVAGGACP